ETTLMKKAKSMTHESDSMSTDTDTTTVVVRVESLPREPARHPRSQSCACRVSPLPARVAASHGGPFQSEKNVGVWRGRLSNWNAALFRAWHVTGDGRALASS